MLRSDLAVFNGLRISDRPTPDACAVNLRQILEEVARVYFGIHPSNIDKTTFTTAAKRILKRWPELSDQEIAHAYERKTELNPEYFTSQKVVVPSIDQIVAPIQDYANIRVRVRAEIYAEQKRMEEASKAEEDKAEYDKKCMDLLQESIAAGEWLGNSYQAANVSAQMIEKFREFWEAITKEERRAILGETNLLVAKAKQEWDENPYAIGNESVIYNRDKDRVVRMVTLRKMIESGFFINFEKKED